MRVNCREIVSGDFRAFSLTCQETASGDFRAFSLTWILFLMRGSAVENFGITAIFRGAGEAARVAQRAAADHETSISAPRFDRSHRSFLKPMDPADPTEARLTD